MQTFIICLVIGFLLSKLLPVDYFVWKIEMWYRNKYGKFTPGDGRNYLQVFKTPIRGSL